VVTVIDAGRIINPKPARNQIEGAVVMGVGMALFEETVYDPRFGAPINNNLADYIVTTNADCPEIDVIFLDYPDKVINPLGARGVGRSAWPALHQRSPMRFITPPVCGCVNSRCALKTCLAHRCGFSRLRRNSGLRRYG
jgi:hypothetical protein